MSEIFIREMKMIRFVLCVVLILGFAAPAKAIVAPEVVETIGPAHGMAMHGEEKYKKDFTHFEYANPDAPKGGSLHMAAIGTFDSLNPYILKGVSAGGMSLLYETLLTHAKDEAFSEYGHVAETIEMPKDRSWVRFRLRKEARWHDGKPMTAEDVKWSFETLMEKGRPFYSAYYANVEKVEIEDPLQVRFVFNVTGNGELPLIVGQLPIFPKHYWADKDFGKTTLDAPLGSGPYKISKVQPGRQIVYERVKDYWAKDLPVLKGHYNFDEILFSYYRDDSVALQAFFAGEFDFRPEATAKSWATAYDVPSVKKGKIVKLKQEHGLSQGMQSFAYNTRRAVFKDTKVRQALAYAFDFEWSNKKFAFGTYHRSNSYFENSELASSGVPEGKELELLEQFRGQIPDSVFTTEYQPPKTSGSGKDIRKNLRQAVRLLDEAGWKVNKETGLREKDGTVLKFEILLVSPSFERWTSPFVQNLEKIGVKANIRVVDASQYQARVESFDFDMIVKSFGQSLSPGNEQRDYWHSEKADINGSMNVIGIKNPVIDQLIDLVIHAPSREDLVLRTRALDRVLLANHYVIPQWHLGYFRLAYWNKYSAPEISPKYDLGVIETWWHDAEKDQKLKAMSGKE